MYNELKWQIRFRHVDVDLLPGFFSLDFSGPHDHGESNWRVLTAAIRVKSLNEFKDAFARAHALMEEHQVPVVLEFILERVTNIAMGTELHNVSEFEEILCLDPSLTLDDVSGSVLQTDPAKK